MGIVLLVAMAQERLAETLDLINDKHRYRRRRCGVAQIINLANEKIFRQWERTKAGIISRVDRRPNRFPLAACIYCAGIGRRETWQGSSQTETCVCVDADRSLADHQPSVHERQRRLMRVGLGANDPQTSQPGSCP